MFKDRLIQKRLATGAFLASAGWILLSATAHAQSVETIIAPEPEGGVNLPGQTEEKTSGQTSSGPVIDRILVEGTQRIDPETVRSYLTVREGDPMNAGAINRSLKTLFATGLFGDVKIRRNANDIIVVVTENPIINQIAFEGNKRVEDTALSAEVQLRPRVVYTRTKAQNDVKRVLEIYRRSGRFAATVEPKIIPLDQNRVDLVFEINEGDVTGVRKISFVGNDYFSDSALGSAILTKESRWYRFLSNNDNYDPDRLTFDRELLRRFYLNNGFADFRVKSAVAELTDSGEDFFITFTVDEGDQYEFGTFDVVSKIPDVDAEPLKALIQLDGGDEYDASAVDDTVLALTEAVGNFGFAFVEIRPVIDKDRENKIINIRFEIEEAPKVYVERIDIRGNVRTLDKVIRREFKLVEGDAFNSSQLRRSRQRIQDLGFFANVNVENIPGSQGDKTVIQVDVEEQSTGSFSIGAGFSTSDGVLGQVGMTERNLLGKGQRLGVSLSLSSERQNYDVSFTEPYFLDRELQAGFDLFHTRRDLQDESSYDLKDTGFGLRMGYRITDNISQDLKYRFSRQRVDNVQPDASEFVAALRGEHFLSEIGQAISYDTRDSKKDTTKGYVVSLQTDLAGLGGDVKYFKSLVRGAYYFPVTKSIGATIGGDLGGIFGINDDVRVIDRFRLGGMNLRGFEDSGAGPRDRLTDDSLGGQYFATSSFEVTFPLGLPEEFGLKGAVFTDFGYLSEVDGANANVIDEGSIRASAGVGVAWDSPLGPIRLDFAHAFMKEDHDETEVFRFNFGTRF